MAGAGARSERDYLKWAFFALMALCTLLVISVDERFLLSSADPEWRHIARFKWWLLLHGISGATALATGPLQFSDRLRRSRPRLHRVTGRIYVAAICLVGAPLGMYIGGTFEQTAIRVQQYFQGGFWWLTTAVALVCILNKQVERHKVWMMRSYGFCLVFVLSRLPDVFHVHWTDQLMADVFWSLVVVALVAPDLILTARDLLRRLRLASKPA